MFGKGASNIQHTPKSEIWYTVLHACMWVHVTHYFRGQHTPT